MILPLVMMDLFWSNQDAGSSIECIAYIVSTIVGIIKSSCITVNQEKLGTNINAAIDDWLSAKDNKETKKIMKKYAVRAKILTYALLYSVFVCLGLYIAIVMFINIKLIFFTDENLMDGKMIVLIVLIDCIN